MAKEKLTSSSTVQAVRPAKVAKDMLSELLGRIQDIRNPALDLEKLSRNIAKAIGCLFSVQTSDPSDSAHRAGVVQAMQHLSKSLEILQEVRSAEAAVLDSSRVIAKVLAVLYTVSKAQERVATEPKKAPSKIGKPTKVDPRRSFQRIAISAEIGLQSDTNFFTGFTEDISMGGIFIATFDIKPIGSQVSISFTLPNGHVVMTGGIVRWVREYNPATPDMHPGMGIQFENVSDEDSKAIHKFFRQRSPMFYEE